MSPEKQRIAIAEAIPGSRCFTEDGGSFWTFLRTIGKWEDDS